MKAILFKEQMFKAVIDGHKTQTRRIVPSKEMGGDFDDIEELRSFVANGRTRYKKDDIVYLKEPFVPNYFSEGYQDNLTAYKYIDWTSEASDLMPEPKWKNKLFMPEKYARYFIRIKDVRVERINDITRDDILTEGLEMDGAKFKNYLDPANPIYSESQAFKSLWISINGLNSWNSNPWVFVYEFVRVDSNGELIANGQKPTAKS